MTAPAPGQVIYDAELPGNEEWSESNELECICGLAVPIDTPEGATAIRDLPFPAELCEQIIAIMAALKAAHISFWKQDPQHRHHDEPAPPFIPSFPAQMAFLGLCQRLGEFASRAVEQSACRDRAALLVERGEAWIEYNTGCVIAGARNAA